MVKDFTAKISDESSWKSSSGFYLPVYYDDKTATRFKESLKLLKLPKEDTIKKYMIDRGYKELETIAKQYKDQTTRKRLITNKLKGIYVDLSKNPTAQSGSGHKKFKWIIKNFLTII